MTYTNLTSEELIHKLNKAGRYPHPDLINAIWDRRSETEPMILALFREAYHDDWENEDDPRSYRFIHAGSFLLSWKNLDALPVFADLFMDELQDLCEWFEEDMYRFGPAAIPYLRQVLEMDSGGEWHYGRALSGDTLARIETCYPDTRDEVAAALRDQLPSVDAIPNLMEDGQMLTSLAAA